MDSANSSSALVVAINYTLAGFVSFGKHSANSIVVVALVDSANSNFSNSGPIDLVDSDSAISVLWVVDFTENYSTAGSVSLHSSGSFSPY